MSLVIFFLFNKDENKKNKKTYFLSKEISILINNWFIMYFLSVVLIGTVYPIFLEVLTDEKISIGPPFFNKLIIPFLIIFLIFMSIGPKLHWVKFKAVKIKLEFFILFIISLLISFLILKSVGTKNLLYSLLISASFYLFFITIKDFFLKDSFNYSQKLSHFGFSLLVLSILLNSIFSSEVITNLRVGENIVFKNEIIYFDSIQKKNNANYKSIIGNFRIEDNKKNFTHLKPELRVYNQPVTTTSEADIKTSLFSDKFLVMNLVKENDYFNVRYQVKSFMIWIWISVLVMSIGGILSFYKRNYEK